MPVWRPEGTGRFADCRLDCRSCSRDLGPLCHKRFQKQGSMRHRMASDRMSQCHDLNGQLRVRCHALTEQKECGLDAEFLKKFQHSGSRRRMRTVVKREMNRRASGPPKDGGEKEWSKGS